MNIFFLSTDPAEAAEMSCDRHSIKMILESAQMLSTALRLHGYDGDEYIYGKTHISHPSTIWTAIGQRVIAQILIGFSHTHLHYAENTLTDTENSIKVRKSCIVVPTSVTNIFPQVL